MRKVICGTVLLVCAFTLVARGGPVRVPSKVKKAVDQFLRAEGDQEVEALARAVKAIRGDLAVAAEALRTHVPLTKGKPGVRHGLTFKSRDLEWEYSIRLPKGYDGEKRFPVLVLPDHGAISPEDGISYWEQSPRVEDLILFRPVIVKHKGDTERFPDQQFFAIDQAISGVMKDALRHLRLHYAVDHDRFFLTGLSQAGYYSWYYAASMPDQFAAVIPESAGGVAVRAAVQKLAMNLVALKVRILHAEGDQICPYADAVRMKKAIEAAGGEAELITYTDADYGGNVPPKRHPGPHGLRLKNVVPFGLEAVREIPSSFTRVIRYSQQGFEGRFRLTPPAGATSPITVKCSEDNGELSSSAEGALYLVPPQAVLERKVFRVGGVKLRPKAEIELLLADFKSHGDPFRLAATAIPLAPR